MMEKFEDAHLPQMEGAILLAGGRSRRMGRDKAAMRLDGEPLGARVFRSVAEVVSRVVVVSNRPEEFPVPGAWVVPDAFPGHGPLEGLASGFEASSFSRALVAACDMPFLSTDLIRFLACQPDDSDAIVPCSPAGPEPLLAVYSRRIIMAARRLLAGGEGAMSALLRQVDCRLIPFAELRPFDPDGRSFINLNFPEDFARAEGHES